MKKMGERMQDSQFSTPEKDIKRYDGNLPQAIRDWTNSKTAKLISGGDIRIFLENKKIAAAEKAKFIMCLFNSENKKLSLDSSLIPFVLNSNVDKVKKAKFSIYLIQSGNKSWIKAIRDFGSKNQKSATDKVERFSLSRVQSLIPHNISVDANYFVLPECEYIGQSKISDTYHTREIQQLVDKQQQEENYVDFIQRNKDNNISFTQFLQKQRELQEPSQEKGF